MTYHKFVKTTPNPRATKKSKGELVGPLLELLFVGEGLGMDEGGEVGGGEDIVLASVHVFVRRRVERLKIELSSIGRSYIKCVQWTGILYRGIADYESRKRLVEYRVIVDVVVIVENRLFEGVKRWGRG